MNSYKDFTIKTDLTLLHAPAFFDFRNQPRVYFPYLSTSGDVPITPLYEYFPVGLKTLKRVLTEAGYTVRIINLAVLLLKHPEIDLDVFVKKIDTKIFGIDLHWAIHCHGSINIASILKKHHPDSKIIFGGISSTFYSFELIRYHFIDMVMRGYDTHIPMMQLLKAVTSGTSLHLIPNLIWKDENLNVVENSFSHKPKTYSCGIDWTDIPKPKQITMLSILELLSMQTAGCVYNCGWCGGSRDAFRRIYQCDHTVAKKKLSEIKFEFEKIKMLEDIDKYSLYNCGSYNESKERLSFFLDKVKDIGLKTIYYEQYYLTSEYIMKKMVDTNTKTILTLSPESHDVRISKLSGRGVYTMDEMEQWICKALDLGIYKIDIWFFIGMPEQTKESVYETVKYCEKLLKKFKGKKVNPLLCPMIPFLDPGSNFFMDAGNNGYKLHFRTLEEHRQGLCNASIINRINYETKWLNREDLVYIGYDAVKQLFIKKGELDFLPPSVTQKIVRKIDETVEFIKQVHEIDCIKDKQVRGKELDAISDEILKRNDEIFFHGVANQTLPINRQVGGRWFDEILDDLEIFEG